MARTVGNFDNVKIHFIHYPCSFSSCPYTEIINMWCHLKIPEKVIIKIMCFNIDISLLIFTKDNSVNTAICCFLKIFQPRVGFFIIWQRRKLHPCSCIQFKNVTHLQLNSLKYSFTHDSWHLSEGEIVPLPAVIPATTCSTLVLYCSWYLHSLSVSQLASLTVLFFSNTPAL